MLDRTSVSNPVKRLLIGCGLMLCSMHVASDCLAQSDKSSDSVRINLLLSGGGTRAAAFAYGAMYELNQLCFKDALSNDDVRLEPRSAPKSPDPASSTECPTVLQQINRVSAVSGGSITAGYYMIHREDGEFFRTFPTLLRDGKIVRSLLLNDRPGSLWKFIRPPVLVVTSVVDTILSVLSVPLFFLPIHLEFTPPAAMALTDGIIESGQLADVYNDLYFDRKTLGSINPQKDPQEAETPQPFPFDRLVPLTPSDRVKSVDLFIHATDISNGRIFTFDKDTFTCLGAPQAYGTFPLAAAAAASSSLPGVFAPVQLDDILASSSPLMADHDKCALISSDRLRPPLLVDGGVSDNLGIGGLLSRVFEEKRLDATARTRKDLFIIINAGAEAESSVPGLGGHLDNSFDTLIKDKTDLSKLMANNLLSQFGLQTIEFRLSDVVTDPLIRRLATEFVEHQNQSESMHSNTHQKLIVNGFTSVELERKVLNDLHRAGMTASGAEIDTLIATGRAVVRARYKELQNEWTKANQKQFFPVCGKVSNFSKFYCWPEEFEQPHLAANRIGPLLQVLTETGNTIRERAIQNRVNLIPALRNVFQDHISMKNELRNGSLGGQVQKLFELLGNRVKNDDEFEQLMNGSQVTALRGESFESNNTNTLLSQQRYANTSAGSPPERWNKAIRDIAIAQVFSDDSNSKEQVNGEALNEKHKQTIAELMPILSQKHPELHDIPQYYLLQANLANLLNKTDRVRSFLNVGTDKFPDNPSMQARAGLMFLIDLEDYRNGLDHLKRGHTLVQQRLSLLQNREKSDIGNQQIVSELRTYYTNRDQVLKQWLAFALVTAPFSSTLR